MDAILELFSPSGRANRAWYFWHVILDDVLIFTLFVALMVVTGLTGNPMLVLPAMGVIAAGLWAGIAITIKRFHDLDKSGWHFLLLGIPLVNLYFGWILLFKKGTYGANSYGADPLEASKASGYIEG